MCYTQNVDTWNRYTKEGTNKVYIILRNDWEDVQEIHGENTPYDDYGLSMIFLFINPEGDIAYSNTRWNHNTNGQGPSDVDQSFTKAQISDLLNVNFNSMFKPSNKWMEVLDEAKRRLANGEPLEDVFDEVMYSKDIAKVSLLGRCNIINKERELLLKGYKWFDDIETFYEGFAKVKYEGKCNFINRDGKLLSKQWFDDVEYFYEGFARVEYEGKFNFINQKGDIISKQWFDRTSNFDEGVARVEYEGKCNFINRDGKLLSKQWFDDVEYFYEGFARVEYEGKFNFINQEGELLSPNLWFDYASDNFYGGRARVEYNGEVYHINQEGEIQE